MAAKNYLEHLSADEYQEIYEYVRISEKILNYTSDNKDDVQGS